MKIILTSAAALVLATAAFAETPDLSGYNNALPVQVMCSNVPAQSGSVNGVLLSDIGYIVEASGADRATTDRIVGVMPYGMSTKDASDMASYLLSAGLTNFELHIRPDRDQKTVTNEVSTVAARDVADGSAPTADNLTSMGNAASDGAEILRVRSTTDQDVSIRRAGGDTVVVSVGMGDTLVAVPDGGTYIASFAASGRNITKATGDQVFGDVTTAMVDSILRTTKTGSWCK
jgi:hypothetical protein